MLAFRKQKHNVICLSQQEGFLINDFLNANGVKALSYVVPGARSGWWYYFRHLIFFVKFCWKNNIHVVYSHLEPANFVASLGQYFIKATTYLCRHHVDEGRLYKFDKDIYYYFTYLFARKVIVVSNRAKEYMINYERISEKKILHINLSYDFTLYPKVNEQNVRSVRDQYGAELLLLTACRLTKYKRPEVAIQLVKELSDRGLNVKMIMLGKGEMFDELLSQINELNLRDKVFLIGYVDNVLEYMQAADYLIHPSVLDSSCVTVKEAGLSQLPAIVCRGIGDFEDYIIDEKNGFLVDAERFVEMAADVIVRYHSEKLHREKIGTNLKKSVLDLFNIDNVMAHYDLLNRVS